MPVSQLWLRKDKEIFSTSPNVDDIMTEFVDSERMF
jgi:hypothetical protein